jgi:dihydrofolate synthase/folylpolyglutamate synthase
MSLDSMRSLLKRMGNPHEGRRTIHVTGSKGKGSTCVMLASILHDAGFKTALFTSPHLHSYTERISVGMQPVSEELFAQGVAEIMPFVKEEEAAGSSISTFGVLTALFFHLAKASSVEWQIVEVGMGGRFDATNVFERKDLAVITPISLEHIEVLGTNQSEIAKNKAGIIAPGSVAILAPQKDPAVRSVIGRRASEVGAEIVYVPKAYKIKMLGFDLEGVRFSMEGNGAPLAIHTPMLGEHQMSNAATAAASGRVLAQRGVPISDENIIKGIAAAKVHGRFELFHCQLESGSVPIVLDGALNDESAAALASSLKALFPGKRCVFVVGVNKDKNINAIWRELLPLCRMVIATQSTSLRAMESHALADQLSFQSSEAHLHPKSTNTAPEALELAKSISTSDDVICVTGSLYVVAEAREYLKKSTY